ncbi:MAG: sigma-54-dependent Fis family transcriptional regulator [Desulfatitalea sp.]|nr:sigma-54 dependent transcriptional regulator [Desulfatitalea sp.]NNK01729.1 sigma-54-dependent Fis family transcriptional regulator [Desulfatitalea sp.]
MESLPEQSPLLIVDDDEGLLFSIRAALISAGLPEPALVSDSRRAVSLIRDHRFQLVLLDLMMAQLDGMEVLKQIKKQVPDTECIIVTAVDEVEMAVQAMRYGAYDYLVKPLNIERTSIAIRHAFERYRLKQGIALFEHPQRFEDLKNPQAFENMVAEDESMALVFRQAEICAESDYNVMITGETGVGKGMLARIIHNLSNHRNGPYIAVNMPAFSHNLFEDDIFGHIRGAYTGAVSDKRGFFEMAQGGTLFLDEITELAPAMQGKLLRVIEEKEFYRLGSTDIVNVDIRILSASNRNVSEAIASGQLRNDLYFRLNEYHIHIPPLRKRTRDVLTLARHFLNIHAKKNRKRIQSLSSQLSDALKAYPFPGNVRELENIIASAVLAETKDTLSVKSVQNLLTVKAGSPISQAHFPSLAQMQQQHIHKALQITGNNRTHAARLLGIGLRTLQRKLKRYGLIEDAT